MPLPFCAESSAADVMIWLLIILGLLIAMLGGVAFLRKQFRSDDSATPAGGGFVLSDLRQLVKEGKLTQEEFDRLKVQVTAAVRKEAEKKPDDPKPKGKPGDQTPPDGLRAP